MNGSRYEVIGVMPRAFVFRNRDMDFWIPMHSRRRRRPCAHRTS